MLGSQLRRLREKEVVIFSFLKSCTLFFQICTRRKKKHKGEEKKPCKFTKQHNRTGKMTVCGVELGRSEITSHDLHQNIDTFF